MDFVANQAASEIWRSKPKCISCCSDVQLDVEWLPCAAFFLPLNASGARFPKAVLECSETTVFRKKVFSLASRPQNG